MSNHYKIIGFPTHPPRSKKKKSEFISKHYSFLSSRKEGDFHIFRREAFQWVKESEHPVCTEIPTISFTSPHIYVYVPLPHKIWFTNWNSNRTIQTSQMQLFPFLHRFSTTCRIEMWKNFRHPRDIADDDKFGIERFARTEFSSIQLLNIKLRYLKENVSCTTRYKI